MKIIGLTGGIGSGKTTVANMFRELGIPVYDSDKEAKLLMNTSKKLKKAIVELFGDTAYNSSGLNRKYIADKVFKDSELLNKLNSIVHPAVREHFLEWAKSKKTNYVIQESAIIFENANEDFYHAIILVTAPIEDRIDRILKRDNTTRESVLFRMDNQWSDEKKKELSSYVVFNDDISKTKLKIDEINYFLSKNDASNKKY